MVVQGQAKCVAGRVYLACHVDVRLRGRGIARRVIVHQNNGGGVQFQCPLDHFTRVDRYMIHGATRLLFVSDQIVLTIKVEYAKLLRFAVRHRRMAIVQQRVPA